jgi:hypothetical protein
MKKCVFVCVFLSTALLAFSHRSDAQDAQPFQASTQALASVATTDTPQDSDTALRRRPATPETTGTNNFTTPVLHPALLNGDEAIPFGMVWVPTGKVWSAREIGSCQWCSAPLTFRKAAFDKKALGMWGTALALTVADIEVMASRPCRTAGTCREGNPFLGQTRAQQFGLRLPVLVGAWMGTAWLRKGDKHLHIGGMKRWWLVPLIYQAASGAGVAANLAR